MDIKKAIHTDSVWMAFDMMTPLEDGLVCDSS